MSGLPTVSFSACIGRQYNHAEPYTMPPYGNPMTAHVGLTVFQRVAVAQTRRIGLWNQWRWG